ncbi:hypothetical protein A6R68_08948, partial [Neotoma lepida]
MSISTMYSILLVLTFWGELVEGPTLGPLRGGGTIRHRGARASGYELPYRTAHSLEVWFFKAKSERRPFTLCRSGESKIYMRKDGKQYTISDGDK